MTYTTGLPSGVGTTFDMPNFTGILHQLTPADTPFFSAIGGLSGGQQTNTTEFEWQTTDLRDASASRQALEGQDAPDPTQRIRATAYNTVEIHQETVGVSYTKLAATGNLGLFGGSTPLRQTGQTTPITDELDWQTRTMLVQMVRDIEKTFISGTFARPSNNAAPRKTRGLLEAISTNVSTPSTLVGTATATASTDVVTFTAHGLANGTQVYFTSIGAGAAGLAVNTRYYVRDTAANTFKVAATSGGAVIDITSDGTDLVLRTQSAVSPNGDTNLNALMQTIYTNGGIMESGTATLMVPPAQKPKLTAAWITGSSYGSYQETSRTVGGVTVNTIITDFGILNVMLNRHMPSDTIAVVSLEQCAPVYLNIPGKGHFFAEPLAKTGAYEKVQLYGEVGLNYGNERMHGKLTGLSV